MWNRLYFYPTVLFFILSLLGDLYAVISTATFAVFIALVVVCRRCCWFLLLFLFLSSSSAMTTTATTTTTTTILLKIHSINHRPRKQTCNHTHRATQYINNLFLGDHWNVFEQKVCCALTFHGFYTHIGCASVYVYSIKCRWRANENVKLQQILYNNT